MMLSFRPKHGVRVIDDDIVHLLPVVLLFPRGYGSIARILLVLAHAYIIRTASEGVIYYRYSLFVFLT